MCVVAGGCAKGHCHLDIMHEYPYFTLVFHSRARPQPPYRKGSLQELCPWLLTEAELKAKDQRSWERKFDDIFKA